MNNDTSDESHKAIMHMDISQLRSALVRCGENNPRRPDLLRCLADKLDVLFQGAGFNDMELADEGLQLRKTALILTPPDDSMILQYK
jgi:hypothetical protein